MPKKKNNEEEEVDEENSNLYQGMTVVQFDPVTITKLLNQIKSEATPRPVSNDELKKPLLNISTIDIIAHAISQQLMKPVRDGYSKFSITPSTITEAFRRIMSTISIQLEDYNENVLNYLLNEIQNKLKSNDPQEKMKVVQYLGMLSIWAKILVKVPFFSIHEIIALLDINLPPDIGSTLYKNSVLGIEKVELR